MVANGFAEEAQSCCGIPFSRQQKVDGLTFGIDRALQVFPLPPDPDVSFIHSPPAPHGTFMPAKRLIQQWWQTDNPPVESGMVNGDTALSHHLPQVAQAQGISQLPADTLGNNIDGIMQAFKGFLDQRQGQATS